MSWAVLPLELQLPIINHLGREDHKNLRLTNRENAATVAPILFSTLHLTPNTRSFNRARNVVSSQYLSPYVRALVYHIGVLEDVHNGFETFRDDIMRLHHPSGSVEEIMEDILWKYHCFLEEIEGQNDFEEREEFDELSLLCHGLSSLESLTIILDEDDPFEPPQDFIGRRTGVQSACSAEGSHFSNLVRAAAGKKLNGLRGWCTSWRCLASLDVEMLAEIDTDSMNDLGLGLFNSELLEMLSEERESALKGLDVLLEKSISSNNYTLHLDFDELPFVHASHELRAISDVVFKHEWPNLRSLALQGIAATEKALGDFLGKHCASLTNLHLDDIEILDEVSSDVNGNEVSSPGSVIGLFRRISEDLNLVSAKITGNFTNRTDESWYVDVEYGDSSCLRRDIELWLAQKSPPPFPPELLKRKIQHTIEGIQGVPEMRGTSGVMKSISSLAEEYSDGSWICDLDLMT